MMSAHIIRCCQEISKVSAGIDFLASWCEGRTICEKILWLHAVDVVCSLKGTYILKEALKFHPISNNSPVKMWKFKTFQTPIKVFFLPSNFRAASKCCKAFLIMIIGYVLREHRSINIITPYRTPRLFPVSDMRGSETTASKYVLNCDIKFYYPVPSSFPGGCFSISESVDGMVENFIAENLF